MCMDIQTHISFEVQECGAASPRRLICHPEADVVRSGHLEMGKRGEFVKGTMVEWGAYLNNKSCAHIRGERQCQHRHHHVLRLCEKWVHGG